MMSALRAPWGLWVAVCGLAQLIIGLTPWSSEASALKASVALLTLEGLSFASLALCAVWGRLALPSWSRVGLWAAAAWLYATWWLSAPTSSEDVWRYLWDGRLWWLGAPTYLEPPNSELLTPFVHLDQSLEQVRAQVGHPELNTIYPPAAQFLFRCASWGGVSLTLWRALLLLAHLLSVEALRALLGRLSEQAHHTGHTNKTTNTGKTAGLAGLTLFALCPIWAFDISQGAHLDVWALCFGLWGVTFSVQERPLLSGLAFGVGVSVKVIPALWLAVLLARYAWQRRWSMVSVMSLSALGAFGLCALPFVTELSHPNAWRGAMAYGGGWRFNESFFGLLSSLGELLGVLPHTISPRMFASSALMITLMWSLWHTRDTQRYSLTAALSVCVVILLFGSPVVFSWYLGWLWALLPLLWVRLTAPSERSHAVFTLASSTSLSSCPDHKSRQQSYLLFSVLSAWPALLPLTYLPRSSVLSGGPWDVGLWWRSLEYLTLSLIFVIGTRYTPLQHTSVRT
jgi:hypothetical protein